MRRAAKRDTVEPEVKQTLQRLGWSVAQISQKGAPDLVIGKGHFLFLVECKTGNGKLTEDQQDWHARWRGLKPIILRDATEALNFHNALLQK
jgi:Holliday junction resolvase